MTKAKHTPGPWQWVSARTQRHLTTPHGSIGISVRLPKATDHPSVQANARLIAAAPELLEALKQAQFFIEGLHPSCGVTGGLLGNMAHAIAKATGESV